MKEKTNDIMKTNESQKKRRGFSLLDVILALGVSSAMYANIAQLQNDMTNNLHAQATADRMDMLADASRSYLIANYRTISSMSSSAIEIPIASNPNWAGIGDLRSTGLLPDDFTTNMPFGQTVHLLVRTIPASGNIPQHLEGMLVTDGGNPMDDRQVGMAMAKMGGNGGGIMKSPPPGVSTSNIQGSFASWSQPISTWSASGITPKTGHVAYDLTSAGSPVAEWLNRYDTGNPESNRMHTNIDMNNNSLMNTKEISGQGNNDILMGDSSHTGRVDMQNGGMACQGNASNCHFDISDDGGFYDHNDSWIEFQGTYAGGGLKVSGTGGNLDVQGKTVTEQGVVTSDNMGVSWTSNPSVSGAVDASATYSGGWINIAGGSGFQGVSSEVFQATKFQDKNSPSYYVIPSGTSNLDQATFTGNISANGLGLNSGYPTGWTGGAHVWDLYAEGTIGTGTAGSLNAFMSRYGVIQSNVDGCNIVVGSGGGCVYGDNKNVALRVPGTSGSKGGSVFFQDQAGNSVDFSGHTGNVGQINLGTADGTASAGSSCSNLGAIAQANDGTGAMLNCVAVDKSQIWKAPGAIFTQLIASSCDGSQSSQENDSDYPELIEAKIIAGHKGASAEAFVNGNSVQYIDNTIEDGRVSQSLTFVVPPKSSWYINEINRVNQICYNIYQ